MTEKTTDSRLVNGMHVQLIKSDKFKTNTVEMKFMVDMDRLMATRRALLPKVLFKGSEAYPTRPEIQDKLDDLYGATLGMGGWRMGSKYVFNVQMDYGNERFIPGEKTLSRDVLSFLNEMIFRPLVKDGAFDEAIVRQEKETLRRQLLAEKDDKMSYAARRMIEEMAKDEDYSVRDQGYLEDIDGITGSTLFDAYKQMMAEARVDLFIVGDFDAQRMEQDIASALTGFGEWNAGDAAEQVVQPAEKKSAEAPKEFTEHDSVQQARLNIGYRSHATFADDELAAVTVMAVVFGGHGGSKLFQHVREKESLAYYINSDIDLFSDKIFVYGGIAPADCKKAMDIIDEQLEAIRAGEITETELQEAKTILINQQRASVDSAMGLIDNAYKQIVGARKRSAEQFIEEIEQVSKGDVVEAATRLQKDTVFLLTSEEGN